MGGLGKTLTCEVSTPADCANNKPTEATDNAPTAPATAANARKYHLYFSILTLED